MSTSTTTVTTAENTIAKEHKVFVGNLSFKTTKESLTSFAEASGKVLGATIIKKHKKSVGYGFITFESEKDAEKAAKELNHQSLEGREVNVEVARPPKVSVSASSSTGTENTDESPKKTTKKRNNKKSKTATEKDQEVTATEVKKDDEEIKESDQKKKSKKKNKSKAAKAVAASEEGDEKETEAVEESVSTATTSSIEEAARRKRANQKIKKRQNRKLAAETKRAARVTEPSKTTLFVANLPYATTTEDLEKIFADYNFVSAHVARMKHGKSKGYGFIEFANEENQLKALESVKDVVLEGRSIYLKVAMATDQKKVEGATEEEKKDDIKEEEEKETSATVDEEKKDVEAAEKAVENLKIDDTKK